MFKSPDEIALFRTPLHLPSASRAVLRSESSSSISSGSGHGRAVAGGSPLFKTLSMRFSPKKALRKSLSTGTDEGAEESPPDIGEGSCKEGAACSPSPPRAISETLPLEDKSTQGPAEEGGRESEETHAALFRLIAGGKSTATLTDFTRAVQTHAVLAQVSVWRTL